MNKGLFLLVFLNGFFAFSMEKINCQEEEIVAEEITFKNDTYLYVYVNGTVCPPQHSRAFKEDGEVKVTIGENIFLKVHFKHSSKNQGVKAIQFSSYLDKFKNKSIF